jgi:hypothetical protein
VPRWSEHRHGVASFYVTASDPLLPGIQCSISPVQPEQGLVARTARVQTGSGMAGGRSGELIIGTIVGANGAGKYSEE